MVGLVIVSHSRALAEAICRLAKAVGREDLPVAFAGGSGPDHAELGTDATDIMDAIRRVNAGDGVVVLMDLGSAVLSARMARELLDGEVPDIRLCPAPLVEGAVAAAIQLGAGSGIDQVCEEALGGLAAKAKDIDAGESGGVSSAVLPDRGVERGDAAVPADARIIRFALDDPNGMHIRPAAEFVKALSPFAAEARIRNYSSDGPFANGRSLNQIALCNIRRGDIAEAALWGAEADRAAAAVRSMLSGPLRGNEIPDAAPVAAGRAKDETAAPRLSVLAPGIAAGTLVLSGYDFAEPPSVKIADAESEVARFDAALMEAGRVFGERKKNFASGPADVAAILDAQMLLLNDAEAAGKVRERVRRDGVDAASAYRKEMRALAAGYRALDNPYMRERAADVDGVAEQVLAVLAGKPADDGARHGSVVVCAPEVTTASLGRWERGRLRGILTRDGGPSSHVAILAKALGIPALAGFVPPDSARAGDAVIMDAERLDVRINPAPGDKAEFERRRAALAAAEARDLADARRPAATRDGESVRVEANVMDALTAEAAARQGAEGVGVVRTEFLFLRRAAPPDEEEQVRALEEIFRHFPGEPLTVRTLDAGGDKEMPWLGMAPEANPFLGVRGVRLMEKRPELFTIQLRAILRAGVGCDLLIMVPMIATVAEVDFCRRALEQCHGELAAAGAAHCWPVRFGIMIETPAAALQAERLAEKVDFFSIGTNDLTQYVLCAERGSTELSALADSMHPAVLRAIAMVVGGARKRDIEVAVCGEMAGDPVAARALVGLGVRVLSMNAGSIARVKRAVRDSTAADLAALAERAVGLATAEETRNLFAL